MLPLCDAVRDWQYRTHMANSALKCRIIILITARSLCSYNNILINFGQLYSNSCYTTFSIAALGLCIEHVNFINFGQWGLAFITYFGTSQTDLFFAELATQVRYPWFVQLGKKLLKVNLAPPTCALRRPPEEGVCVQVCFKRRSSHLKRRRASWASHHAPFVKASQHPRDQRGI